jgi:DNA polymerase-3 subunit gamma/tau
LSPPAPEAPAAEQPAPAAEVSRPAPSSAPPETADAEDGRGPEPDLPSGAAARHTGPVHESGSGGWASAPSAPGSAPSWASESGDAGPSWAAPGGGAQPAPAGSPLARARAAVAAEEPERDPERRIADDSAASADDEDIEALGEVGRPVIERLLGGRVIDEGP